MGVDTNASPRPSGPPPSFPTMSPNIFNSIDDDEDLYGHLKSLLRHIEFIDIQEEYVKNKQQNLKHELLRAQVEVKRIQSIPLIIGQCREMVDQNNGIVGSDIGSKYYVRILSILNRELLKPSASVALHRHSKGVSDVTWSSDSHYICSASDDRTVSIWDVRSPVDECIKVLRSHSSFVLYINFHLQSNLIISGSFDKTIRLWNIKTAAAFAPSMPRRRTSPPQPDPLLRRLPRQQALLS